MCYTGWLLVWFSNKTSIIEMSVGGDFWQSLVQPHNWSNTIISARPGQPWLCPAMPWKPPQRLSTSSQVMGCSTAHPSWPPNTIPTTTSRAAAASAETKSWAALRFTPGAWGRAPPALAQERAREAPGSLPTLRTVCRHPSVWGAMQWLAPGGHVVRVTTENLYKKGLEFPQRLTLLSVIQTSASSFPQ